MLNITDLQNKVNNKLTSLGIKAAFNRLGARLGQAYIVIATSENKGQESLNDNVSKICYVANKIKFVPQPGDTISFNKEEWLIKDVVKYEPSAISIAYKLLIE
jgi:hypothetical protein